MCAHFRSRDKDGSHTIRSAEFRNPVIHANLMALSVTEPELWASEVLCCDNRDFQLFLLLWLWSWHDDLHIWICLVFHWYTPDVQISVCCVEGFRKLLSWQTYRQTDITKIIYHAALRVVSNTLGVFECVYAAWSSEEGVRTLGWWEARRSSCNWWEDCYTDCSVARTERDGMITRLHAHDRFCVWKHSVSELLHLLANATPDRVFSINVKWLKEIFQEYWSLANASRSCFAGTQSLCWIGVMYRCAEW